MHEVITEKEIRQGFRLSPRQEQLWRVQQQMPNVVFRAVCAIAIEGALEVLSLQNALGRVVQRHEICRTSFCRRPELKLPIQVVNEVGESFWRIVDLRGVDARRQELRFDEIFIEEKTQPLELERESLLRATLVRLSAERNVLVLNLPSLCADARTLQNLSRDLADTYGASRDAIEDEVTQYVQFSEWLHEVLAEEDAHVARDYWLRQPALPQLTLPLEKKSVGDHQFALEIFTFKIADKCDNEPFLLSCWQSLLSRLTAQREIGIGVLHEGRNDEALQDACGPFAKRLPLVAQVDEQQRFIDLWQQTERALNEADKWQDYFVSLGNDAGGRANENAFGFEFEQRTPHTTHGLQFTTYKPYVCDGPFKLKLACVRSGLDLNVDLHYDANLFQRKDVERIAEEYETLLTAAVADPQTRLDRLPIVGSNEREQVVFNFNDTKVDYPDAHALHELFEERVELTPSALAIEFEDQQLSYAELNARANQLAHHLRRLGVGADTLIGVLMERSIEMAVGLIAILKAGGAYVPFDPEYPAERLRFMIDDSRAPVLLTQSKFVATLPEHAAQVVCLDTDWPSIAQEQTTNLSTKITSANLAYVIYTSGSTGQPKGAMVHHGGVVNCLRWMQQTYRLDETDKFVLKTSLNFDPSVWELFWPLWVGASVYIARPGGQLDNAYLIEQITKRNCTSIYFVPSMLRVFLEEAGVEECRSLKRVICGGEALALETIDRFYDLLRAELHHSYGPTETSIAATEWTCEPRTHRRIVPMGFPLANTQTYALDQNLALVPIGVLGELYIGGLGVGRGYLQRAELTAERFIPDPFSTLPGARLYRTGDLVRYLPDGSLEFAGRVDHQVKIRGFRIELGEIETQVSNHPTVKETVVVAREDKPGEKRLVAYLVPIPGQSLLVNELREFVKARLPEYMVPAAFVILKALPLMHNGKVDRNQLPEPEQSGPDKEQLFVAPRTTIEEMLAVVWTELLGVEQVDVHHNFFDLGGHSLLGTQLVSRVRKIFQVELPLRTLFEAPTIAGMAEAVEALLKNEQPQQPPLVPFPRDTQLPLSFAQQRLWFLDQLQPGSPFYNLFAAVRLQGELNVSALEQSFNEIIRRHEALRTIFPNVNGKPVQVIVPAAKLALQFTDLRELPADERETEALRLATEDVQRPFDLSLGPLLRLTLLQTGEHDHILLLCIHHIVSDAWSSRVLMRELVTFYESFANGERPRFPALPVQYADFARWQREWLQGDVLQSQLDYWRRQLDGAPPVLELPIARPRVAVQTFRGARESHLLPSSMSIAIDKLSRQEGVTPFMVLLAAFQILLSRYTGQHDIVVGTPIAGRGRIEIEELIGFFVNTLVLRTDLSGNPSFAELLRRVRDVALGAAAHQDLPFEKLVEELQPERDLSRTPLFQVMFALQNVPKDSYSLPNLTLSPVEADTGAAKLDLTMFFHPNENGLLGILEYNTDLFEADSIKRMWLHFETLLQSLVADPEQRILNAPLVTEPERDQMIVEWNDTAREFPDIAFHELFEEQVRCSPGAIAVTDDHTKLTYFELNERANRLARFLINKGVAAEAMVAVLAPRGISLLTAMLAIFKAGAVYLPLDPRHPTTRQAKVLDQSGASLLLVSEDIESAVESIEESTNLERRSSARNLAYVIFTSGSTGMPKGSMIEQRGMINHLYIKVRELELTASDVVAQTASQCFDISVWQLLSPLLVGAQVRVFNDEVVADPKALLQALETEGITIAETVPSMLHALLEEAGNAATRLRALRWMVATGEALPPEICRVWQQAFGSRVRLLNAYGPTECSDDVTHYEVIDAPAEHATRVPIGHALNNTQLYILDRELGLVPAGVSGELFVGGAGVGRGYLNDARRTSESFVPDPFGSAAGSRLYRTGDLCRYLPNGEIEFLGRIDDQVKVRGFRIELGEIEAALAVHDGLAQAAVVVREDNAGDKTLVAYVVPSHTADATLLPDDLRVYLKGQLPDYMIPQVFILVEALPLTANGKLDRRALPAPDHSQTTRAKSYQAPRNETETTVAEIWSEVLGRESISVEDNFFSVGGHSLLATQVISRVRQRFEIELPLRVMFESPTIAQLSLVVERTRATQTQITQPALVRRNRRERNLDQLLAKVQSLSEAEAHETLQNKKESTQAAAK